MDNDADYEFFKNKLVNKIYISKSFDDRYSSDPENPKKARFISTKTECDPFDEFIMVKDELVLRRGPKECQEWKLLVYEDNRHIQKVVLQRFSLKSGKPIKHSFNFSHDEITKLINFLIHAKSADFSQSQKFSFNSPEFEYTIDDIQTLKSFMTGNEHIIREALENTVTSHDLVSVAYRKKQLSLFERMLKEENLRERDWQTFFENNPWIFGYGLNYIFNTNLPEKKLEQTVFGSTFKDHGKRTDALLKTAGFISSICLVEIKTPKTNLLKSKPYRPGVWSLGEEVVGGIAQIQKTVASMLTTLINNTELKDSEGNPTGEKLYAYEPKSYLIIGSLNEFITDRGVNDDKFSSFQFFRRNIHNPEIITFDELYERARHIVNYGNENTINMSNQAQGNIGDDILNEDFSGDPYEDEDIPF